MTHTLLIADDEQLECDAIELLIHRANLPFHCIKAKNGQEAVALAARYHPEIAMLDIKMPGMDGIEAARIIRQSDAECHIVFLTAWGTFEFAHEALKLGATEYLVKPVQSKDVYTTLDKILDELDKRKTVKEKQSEDIKEVLNLFSREFFTSLKYGEIAKEAMRSYFSMQDIHTEQGVALIIGGMESQAIERVFGNIHGFGKLQLCYFPSTDRTTVLVFSRQPAKIVEMLAGYQSEAYSYMGSGMFFTELSGISRSIRTASMACSHALHLHVRFQRFSDVMNVQKDSSKLREFANSMVTSILSGETNQARETAHEMLDMLNNDSPSTDNAAKELYELLVVSVYELTKAIPLLNVSPPIRSSMMEQETYLMDLIDMASEAVKEDRRDRYSRMFRFVDNYLHSHYAQALSVDGVAKMVDLNGKYFSRLFKLYLGTSFVEYLTNIRMEKARQLLDEGTHSVKEVASMTGFGDGNYFTRVFRQAFGITPSSYRDVSDRT